MKKSLIGIPIFIALLLTGIYISPEKPSVDSVPENPENPNAQFQEIQDVVKPGETMFDIFKRYRLNINELFSLKEASATIHRLRKITAGQSYKIRLGPDNNVLSLTYQINNDEILNITRAEPGFKAEKVEIEYDKRIGKIGGVVKNNLVSSLGENSEAIALALQLSDIFSWDIDFTTDLRRGDAYKIIVEELWRDGRFQRYGGILGAEFTNDGQTYVAYRFEVDGRMEYFDAEGKSLQRDFLKAPLSYRRISSGFSYNRRHPILKIRRPHLGIDYVAPAGTPVSSLGDGIIQFSGYKGANGNLVVIRHPKGFTTYYGHLSRTRKGIRRGARVAQGDVIGYVGATGMATGAHLDFRIRKNDRFINPLKVDVPRGRTVPKTLLADFDKARYEMGLELASVLPSTGDPAPAPAERAVASGR